MSVSSPWTTKTSASVARKNKTSILTLSGTDINALDKTKYKLVACNATGSGYTINHIYHFSDDGSIIDDISSLPDHLHNGTGAGGNVAGIYRANTHNFNQSMCRPTDWVKAVWNQTVSGTGTIEDGTGGSGERYIRMRPNGTSGSGATISYPMAANAGFGYDDVLMGYVYQLETASSLAFHIGWNADDITAADSNTSKVQLEVCTATNNNHWIRTANGSANSASDMGVAIDTSKTSCQFWAFQTGTPTVKAEVNAGSTFTKTTHIPTSGQNATGNIMKFSIKNSTAADRPLRAYGAHLTFTTESSWIYG